MAAGAGATFQLSFHSHSFLSPPPSGQFGNRSFTRALWVRLGRNPGRSGSSSPAAPFGFISVNLYGRIRLSLFIHAGRLMRRKLWHTYQRWPPLADLLSCGGSATVRCGRYFSLLFIL